MLVNVQKNWVVNKLHLPQPSRLIILWYWYTVQQVKVSSFPCSACYDLHSCGLRYPPDRLLQPETVHRKSPKMHSSNMQVYYEVVGKHDLWLQLIPHLKR